MKANYAIPLSALLAISIGSAWAAVPEYQPNADSTGGTSQAKGDLLITRARAATTSGSTATIARYQPAQDSTGGSSHLRGELASS